MSRRSRKSVPGHRMIVGASVPAHTHIGRWHRAYNFLQSDHDSGWVLLNTRPRPRCCRTRDQHDCLYMVRAPAPTHMSTLQCHTIALFTTVEGDHGQWCPIGLHKGLWTHPGETFAVISKCPVICAQAIILATFYIQNCFDPIAGVPSTVGSTPCRVR